MGGFKIAIFSLKLCKLLLQTIHLLANPDAIPYQLFLLRFYLIDLSLHLPVLHSKKLILLHQIVSFDLEVIALFRQLSKFTGGHAGSQHGCSDQYI